MLTAAPSMERDVKKKSTTHHKLAVNFPAEVYEKIKSRATHEGVSLSDMAVKLTDCGLFDYEESEAHDERQ